MSRKTLLVTSSLHSPLGNQKLYKPVVLCQKAARNRCGGQLFKNGRTGYTLSKHRKHTRISLHTAAEHCTLLNRIAPR